MQTATKMMRENLRKVLPKHTNQNIQYLILQITGDITNFS